MPNPLDNLEYNLKVLTDLANATPGTKLAYDASEGRFALQGPGLKQTITRTFSGDSVTSTENFADPIKAIFAAAVDEVSAGRFSRRLIETAQEGLKSLVSTYRQGSSAKHMAAVLVEVEAMEIADNRGGPFADKLYNKYQRCLLTKVNQGTIIRAAESGKVPQAGNVLPTGVCMGFCVDWLSRKIHLLRRKPSYAVSKKTRDQLGPDLDLERMTKKYNRILRPLQNADDSQSQVSIKDVCDKVVMQL
jgi:hypothetical protein